MEGMIRPCSSEAWAWTWPIPRHDLRRCDAPVRLRQARPAREAAVHRVTDVMKDVDFKVFSGAANMKAAAWCRPARARWRRGGISRGEIDAYTEFVGSTAPRAWPTSGQRPVPGQGNRDLQSPIVKNIHETARRPSSKRTGAQNGDLIFFGADKARSSTTPSARCASRSATANSATERPV